MVDVDAMTEWLVRKKEEGERESAFWARRGKPRQEYYAIGMAYAYGQALRHLQGLAGASNPAQRADQGRGD